MHARLRVQHKVENMTSRESDSEADNVADELYMSVRARTFTAKSTLAEK